MQRRYRQSRENRPLQSVEVMLSVELTHDGETTDDRLLQLEDAPVGRVSEFISSIFEILNNDAMSQWIKWCDGGKALHVVDPQGFHANVSRIYWRQSSFRSFSRQLHMYGFKRTYEDVAMGQYKYFHESFQQVCESGGVRGRRHCTPPCAALCAAPRRCGSPHTACGRNPPHGPAVRRYEKKPGPHRALRACRYTPFPKLIHVS
jgi:hypothetical protein